MDFTTTPRSPQALHTRLVSWPSCFMALEIPEMSNDGLIYEVANRMDQDEIVEVLNLDMDAFVEALRDYIIDNREAFNEYLEIDE